MTGGITPVDNVFELIGQQQCSSLMRYIFIETLGGKAIFGFGFILALVRSLNAANFRPVIIFSALFFSCLILLVMPKATVRQSLSVMEENGFDQVTTEGLLRKAGIQQLSISPVLALISRGVSSFSNGAVGVVDQLRLHNTSFLNDPFMTAKLWLLTRDKVNAGVSDPLLKDRLHIFYQDQYFPAARKFRDEGFADFQNLWPGAEQMIAAYSLQARSDWQALKDDLYEFMNRDGAFERLSTQYYEGSSLNDAAVRALIEADAARTPWTYTALSFSGQADALKAGRINTGIAPGAGLDLISRLWLSGFPVVYGSCLWSLWAAFPFILVFMILSADITVMGLFMKYLLIVKLIPLFWSIIDKVSIVVFDLQAALSGGKEFLWDMPLVGVVALLSLAVFIVPLLMLIKERQCNEKE